MVMQNAFTISRRLNCHFSYDQKQKIVILLMLESQSKGNWKIVVLLAAK